MGEKMASKGLRTHLGRQAVIMETLLIKELEDDFVKLLKLSVYTKKL